MKKFTLYMGLNDKDTKTQKINYFDAYELANNTILKLVKGVTISRAMGVYTHDDGYVVTEESLRIELLFTDLDTVKTIANELKELFNQDSILIEVQKINGFYY